MKRKAHKLRGNTKELIPGFFITFDTEANTKKQKIKFGNKTYNGEIQTFKIGFAQFLHGDKIISEDFFYSLSDFKNFIIKSLNYMKNKTKRRTLYIFAHNLDYDFQLLNIPDLINYEGWKWKNGIDDRKNFMQSFKYNKFTIKFISSTNIFHFPLKKLAKTVGMKKGEWKKANENEKDLKEYLKNDVEILTKVMLKYFEFLKKHHLGNFAPTIAAQALNAFKHRFMKHNIFVHADPKIDALEIEAYRGGRTEAFQLGKTEDVYDYDVNSLYPYVMQKYSYPVKLLHYEKEPDLNYVYQLTNKEGIGFIVKGIFYAPTNYLGIKFKSKLIFPTGWIKATITNCEFKYLIENNGKIEKIEEIAVYQLKPIFKDYVNYFYNLKRKYKQKNNEVFYLMTKLFLNSLYGKFGQRVKESRKLTDYEKEKYKKVIENLKNANYFVHYDENKGLITFYKKGNDIYMIEKRKTPSPDSFIAIAAFVTGNARMELWNIIDLIRKNGGKVYYCDTDSVFTDKKGEEILKENNLISNYELGKLKLEEYFKQVEIRGAKDYTTNKNVKIKGIRKNAKKLNENKYKQIEFISFKMKERFRNDIKGVLVLEKIKELKRNYEKGEIKPLSGKINPFHFKTLDQFEAGFTNYEDYTDNLISNFKEEKYREFVEFTESDLFDSKAMFDNTLTKEEALRDLYKKYQNMQG